MCFRICYVDAVVPGLVCIPTILVHIYVRTQIRRSIRNYYQIEREMHVASRKKEIRSAHSISN